MGIEVIDGYTYGVLEKTLLGFGIKEKFAKDICDDINEQMMALLYHWNDVKFRKAILVLGLEEGKFYEPDADVEIKEFVVVTVRNSLIEIVFSKDSWKMELDKHLPEHYVKTVTSEAINYFKDIDFKELSTQIAESSINDKYSEISKKYPMAWEALVQLGNCMGKKVAYNKIKVDKRMDLEFINQVNVIYAKMDGEIIKDEQPGISEEFSSDLLIQLRRVLYSNEISIFYVDSFKMLTRNFEKLMKILEILLENDKVFLTSNYLITSSYIGKRQNVYRAVHNPNDAIEKINDSGFLLGLSGTHLNYLKKVLKDG